MALFTTTDRDNIKTALITAAVEGSARVKIGNHEVETYTLDELRKLLVVIQEDLAADLTPGSVSRMGIRMVKTVPGGAG